jgi:hypothetical protein
MIRHFVIAYVDPGTGSYLFQLAAAGLFGALYAIGQLKSRFRRLISKVFNRQDSQPK